jgi:hypothetical protein
MFNTGPTGIACPTISQCQKEHPRFFQPICQNCGKPLETIPLTKACSKILLDGLCFQEIFLEGKTPGELLREISNP